LSDYGLSERCFPVQVDDSPMNCAAYGVVVNATFFDQDLGLL